MNFDLSTEQQDTKDRAAEFADREVAPHAAELDREDRVPFETLEKMADAGLHGPVRTGGVRRGRGGLPLLLSPDRGAQPRRRRGRRDARGTHQRGHAAHRDVRHRGAEGAVGAAAGAGREHRMLRPYGTGDGLRRLGDSRRGPRRVDGGYRISGHKQWVTNGRVAGTMILFARAEGGAREGVTAFVVAMDAEGISFGTHAKKMGVISATTDDVLFDDVFVPEEDRLGEEGRGLRVALGTLDTGRIGIAAQALGHRRSRLPLRHATTPRDAPPSESRSPSTRR